jgi:hypothetical protein
MSVSVIVLAIFLVLFSQNYANAPGPNDVIYEDTSGSIVEDTFIMMGVGLVFRFVITPVLRKTSQAISRGLRGRFSRGPGKWYKVKEGMSSRAARYQTQVTGKSVDNAYVVNKVKFDGFNGGKLIDAKGPGYSNFVGQNGEFHRWFQGQHALVDQARHQISAAGGASVEWHVAEKKAFEAIKKLFKANKITKIKVIHTSPSG